jgi:hypothetical protein
VEAGLPLALLSYGGFVVVFLVLFLLVSGREIQLKKSSGGVVGFLCRRQCVFGRILSVFFSADLKPNLRTSVDFCLTRAI